MPNWEKTWAPETGPEQGSGIRKKPEGENKKVNPDQVVLTDQQWRERGLALEEQMENYPDDPHEDSAPITETDTAKVWGVSLDEEKQAEQQELEAERARLAAQLSEYDRMFGEVKKAKEEEEKRKSA